MSRTLGQWEYAGRYIHAVFGDEDVHLRELTREAATRGLPDIAVSAEVGRLLALLVGLGGATKALEVGTLGGYSAMWIARALAPGGQLITIEHDDRHAAFAEEHLARAGLGERVDVRRGAALDVLPVIAEELGPASLDFVFIDADKTEYPRYFELVRPLLRVGSVFVADNALGTGSFWIDEEHHPSRTAIDRLNRTIAADRDFSATLVPLREGLLIARRSGAGRSVAEG